MLFCAPLCPLRPQFPQPPKPVDSSSSMSPFPVLHPAATILVKCLSTFLQMLGSCLSSQFFPFLWSPYTHVWSCPFTISTNSFVLFPMILWPGLSLSTSYPTLVCQQLWTIHLVLSYKQNSDPPPAPQVGPIPNPFHSFLFACAHLYPCACCHMVLLYSCVCPPRQTMPLWDQMVLYNFSESSVTSRMGTYVMVVIFKTLNTLTGPSEFYQYALLPVLTAWSTGFCVFTQSWKTYIYFKDFNSSVWVLFSVLLAVLCQFYL